MTEAQAIAIRPGFRRSTWLVFLLLALAIQTLVFWPISHTGGRSSFLPRSLPVTQVDADKLQRIREQWKRQEARQLPHSSEARPEAKIEDPADARYESDHARRVEREQRAARTAPLPQRARVSRSSPQTQKRITRSKARLSELGVPIPIASENAEARSEAAPDANAGASADQFVLDKDLPEGSENLLNTAEARFYSFFSRFQEAVVPNWSRLVQEVPRSRVVKPDDYLTEVVITLEGDGTLYDVEFVKYSGIREFDRAVESSLRQAKRFAHPPRAMMQADGRVRFQYGFTVHVSEARLFEFLPPQRIDRAFD